MYRLIAFLLLLALSLSLCACGKTPVPAQTDREETEQQPAASSAPAGKPDPSEKTDLPVENAAYAALARAVYPEMAPYPDPESSEEAWTAWQTGVRAQRDQPAGYADGLEAYLRASLTEFLSGAGKENRVCAPLNIYMALAMLAEVTDGESRAQILSLLGEKDTGALRTRVKALWNAFYRDDGAVTSLLAASLWLSDRVGYVQETMDVLARDYYASSFLGTMGSPEYDQALRNWLNEQTGDLLKDQTSGLSMDARTVLALATTIYFKAAWSDKFSEAQTTPQAFHTPAGEQETDFLHSSFIGSYYWGDGFAAVSLSLESGGAMWFILPDEGVSPEELLGREEAMGFILSREKYNWEQQKRLTVHFAAPRFDVSSDLDLIDGLKDLGVRNVFDSAVSDFTPLTTDVEDPLYVSQAKHAARVMIDEEGCTGAAYTVFMVACGEAMAPEESVDFTADRPFLFLVTNFDGLPLFTGIVNTVE